MDLQKLTIGQMARLNHISEQTLRLYDRKGLILPAYVDEATGYRYYHIGQSARLDLIQYLKASGLTLQRIGLLLEQDDRAVFQALLTQRLEAIDGELGRLAKARTAVARSLENMEKYRALPKNSTPFLEFIPARCIYPFSCDANFFSQDDAGYEYMLRQLKQHLVLHDIPLAYFNNVGTLWRKERIVNNEFFCNEVFMFVDRDDLDPCVETAPGGMCLCICSDDFYAETQNAKRLLAEIKRLGYTICGDYLCEVVMDFPAREFHKRDFFYKLQIPVILS